MYCAIALLSRVSFRIFGITFVENVVSISIRYFEELLLGQIMFENMHFDLNFEHTFISMRTKQKNSNYSISISLSIPPYVYLAAYFFLIVHSNNNMYMLYVWINSNSLGQVRIFVCFCVSMCMQYQNIVCIDGTYVHDEAQVLI